MPLEDVEAKLSEEIMIIREDLVRLVDEYKSESLNEAVNEYLILARVILLSNVDFRCLS